MQATFQTRPVVPKAYEPFLAEWGALYGRIERKLFAAYCAAGNDAKAVERSKPQVCAREGITARQVVNTPLPNRPSARQVY